MNWRKVVFGMLMGWWSFPVLWIGQFIGDLLHYNETKAEREERHNLED